MPEPRTPLLKRALVLVAISAAILSPVHAGAQDASLLRATVLVTGLTSPVAFVQDPSQPNVQFVVQQGGRIRVIRDGALLAADFLDLSGAISAGGEQGLLGLAFAPDYATSRRFFVNFTNPSGHTVIARFLRSASDPVRADAATRVDLRWPNGSPFITQPYANHNGGDLHFGSDGYLYIGMGDGGSSNDPFNFAQDPMSLLGKMLRIDVAVPDSDPEGYNVPFDNPFVGNGAFLPEIWALGLRNPFRFTVDAIARGGSGALVIGDVGQASWEEVDFDPFGRGGRNYGWRNREGAHNNVTTVPPTTLPLIDPIVEYSRADGTVITGGVVYRGSRLGIGFFGRYFFADFGSTRVWSVRLAVNPATGEAVATGRTEHTLGIAVGNISAFGLDGSCEIHMLDYTGGRVLRIDPTAGPAGAGCATPDPFLALGGGAWLNGGWLPPGDPLAAGVGEIGGVGAPGAGTGTAGTAVCGTPAPGANWVCINGGWLPPGHPLIGGTAGTGTAGGGTAGTGTSGAAAGASGTAGSAVCTSPMPGASWVCVNGGWLPPGHPLAVGATSNTGTSGGSTSGTVASAATGAGSGGAGTGGSAACASPMPAANWVCITGGWLPPGHPLIGGTAGTGTPGGGTAGTGTSGAAAGASGTAGSAACATPMPGAAWVCVNGGWLPPGHPLIGGGP